MAVFEIVQYTKDPKGSITKTLRFEIFNGTYKQARAKALSWAKEVSKETNTEIYRLPSNENLGHVSSRNKRDPQYLWFTKDMNAYVIRNDGSTGKKISKWW